MPFCFVNFETGSHSAVFYFLFLVDIYLFENEAFWSLYKAWVNSLSKRLTSPHWHWFLFSAAWGELPGYRTETKIFPDCLDAQESLIVLWLLMWWQRHSWRTWMLPLSWIIVTLWALKLDASALWQALDLEWLLFCGGHYGHDLRSTHDTWRNRYYCQS